MIKNCKFVTPETRISFIVLQSGAEHKLICAEIGVWIGENAQDMLTVDPEMELYAIDAYTNIAITDDTSQGTPEEVKEKARKRLAPFGDRVKFIYKQSEDAYEDYPDEFFDYVYIDGDHSYFSVYRDMKLWWPKVKQKGMIAGHDVGMPSISKAVIDFVVDNGLLHKMQTMDHPPVSDWWIEK